MRTRDLLRLAALGCVLLIAFVVIALRLRPSAGQTTVPTLMSLPSVTPSEELQVAALPTSTNTEIPTETEPNTDTATATSSRAPSNTPANTATDNPTETATNTATLLPTIPPLDSPEAEAALPPSEPVANQVVITFAPGTSAEEQAAYVESIGGEITQSIDSLNMAVVEVTEEADDLPDSPVVAAAEPDYYVSAQMDTPPSDPYYPQQWALPAINIPNAWYELAEEPAPILVAVIDSGICLNHEDLSGQYITGWDFVEGDNIPQDDYGHGCGVAGIIAARSNNNSGIAGVAPNARILPLRVLDRQGFGTYSNVAAAIVTATNAGARIINLSLGGSIPSSTIENAVNYAVMNGVIVIAAAGNTFGGPVLYPAAYPSVIAVGSVDANLQPSGFSSVGPQIDTYAPGGAVLTLTRTGAYGIESGTSFAAPHVAGVAALELARGRGLSLNGGLIAASGAPIPTATPIEPTVQAQATNPPVALGDKPIVPRLSSILDELRRSYAQNAAQALQQAELNGLEVDDQQVQVNLITRDANSANSVAQLIPGFGGTVTAQFNIWVDAWVPISSLEAMTNLPGVTLVQPVVPVFPVEDAQQGGDVEALVGSETSQGVEWSNADDWIAAGYDGTGINIAIIDVNFASYTLVQPGGDLPATINCYPNCAALNTVGDNHGTAVAEIIHDMAPDANLTFATPGTATQMAQYIVALAQTNDIISSSMTFPASINQSDPNNSSDPTNNLDPNDGTGPVSVAINTAYNTYGAIYVQAAGNNANSHWEGLYNSTEGDNLHQFDAQGACGAVNSNTVPDDCEVNSLGTLPVGASMSVSLRWNAWPTTTQDYDLYLVKFNTTLSQWQPVGGAAQSLTRQSGAGGAAPLEWFQYTIPTGQNGTYGLLIQNFSADGTQVLDLNAFFSGTFENFIRDRSLVDPATPLGAFTVGAVFEFAPDDFRRESPSSAGRAHPPNNNWWPLPGTGNAQPRISAYSRVDTAIRAGVFTGTSAAAPHVAGAAALVMEHFPDYAPLDVRNFLEQRAIDVTGPAPVTAGYDIYTGTGRLWLGDPNDTPPATVTRTPTNTYTPTNTPTATNTPTSTAVPNLPNGIGIYNPADARWYLRDNHTAGFPDWLATYGGFGNDKPVVGDWNGNGTSTLGIYYPATGNWYLRNRNDSGAPDYPAFAYGGFGNVIPVVGDWDGDGRDGIGVYDPADGRWYLRNSLTSGSPSYPVFAYGGFGIPVVGDWDGDGRDGIGIYNPTDGKWYLRNNLTSGTPSYTVFAYGGFNNVMPVVGDWDGDGDDTIGVYEPANGNWYLRNFLTSGTPSYPVFAYGGFGLPVVGVWSINGAFSLDGNMDRFSGDWVAIMAANAPDTPTPTSTSTLTPTQTPSATITPSLTASLTSTETPTTTASLTATIAPTETLTPTIAPTDTLPPTATFTETSTETPIPTATFSDTPTVAPTETPLPPTATFTETATDMPPSSTEEPPAP